MYPWLNNRTTHFQNQKNFSQAIIGVCAVWCPLVWHLKHLRPSAVFPLHTLHHHPRLPRYGYYRCHSLITFIHVCLRFSKSLWDALNYRATSVRALIWVIAVKTFSSCQVVVHRSFVRFDRDSLGNVMDKLQAKTARSSGSGKKRTRPRLLHDDIKKNVAE